MKKFQINYQFAESLFSKNLLESINLFRAVALEIDENPCAIVKYQQESIFENLCHDQSSTCLERTQLIEALSYGDPGVALAAPGPSLSGLMLRELGSEEQKKLFFSYLSNHRCATFLGVTEPRKGSDAAHLETRLSTPDKENYFLSGEKCFIGHGADAPLGVIMARRSNGPLGVCAIVLGLEDLNRPEVERNPLNMFGLRGARLAKISFNQLPLRRENILGLHLSSMKSGMMAMMKTFNRMRPVVAAFALGHSQAVLDYARENIEDFYNKDTGKIGQLQAEINWSRALLYECAAKIDGNPFDNSYASIAKLRATQLAEKVTINIIKSFGVNGILRHPLLMKWYRDVFGFEYMEGTSIMQLKNIYQGYQKIVRKSHDA